MKCTSQKRATNDKPRKEFKVAASFYVVPSGDGIAVTATNGKRNYTVEFSRSEALLIAEHVISAELRGAIKLDSAALASPDGMVWELLHPKMTFEALGLIPEFFTPHDPRPAREQIAEHYVSGWHPVPGLTIGDDGVMTYPGDPPFMPLAQAKLRDELLVFYPGEFLAIIQPDRVFEVAKVD